MEAIYLLEFGKAYFLQKMLCIVNNLQQKNAKIIIFCVFLYTLLDLYSYFLKILQNHYIKYEKWLNFTIISTNNLLLHYILIYDNIFFEDKT